MFRRVFLVMTAAGLAAAGGGIAFWFHVDGTWQAMLDRVEAQQAELENRDVSRPAPYGDTTAGDAWDDYQTAFDGIERDVSEQRTAYLIARDAGDTAAATKLRAELLNDHINALAALHAGAHRETARYPIKWYLGFDAAMPPVQAVRSLAHLAVIQAEARIDAGRPERAVEPLLDAMQLGRDMMHAPRTIDEMIGAAVLAIASREALIDGNLLDRLSPAALAKLRDGMRGIDASLAIATSALIGEALLFARQVSGPNGTDLGDDWGLATSSCWRHGFSASLVCAEHVQASLDFAAEYAARANQPWSERKAHLLAAQNAAVESTNPLTAIAMPNLVAATTTRLSGIVSLRLTRMAVEYRLTGEVRSLPDPFGASISHLMLGDHVEFTAAGPATAPPDRRTISIPASPR